MTRILILARGVVGKYMSSPGIRAYYQAQVLRDALPDAQVTLAITNKEDAPKIPGVRVVQYGILRVLRLIAQHDIIISSAFMPHYALFFRDKLFVADMFSQYFIEWMELARSEKKWLKQTTWMNANRTYLNMQLTMADFVICANERQRDTYVGSLSALGLIDPDSYEKDDTLRRYIDVAPHGIRPDEITHEKRVLKGEFAGIKETDKVLLWNGGTVAWYDPAPFLKALHILSKERDDIKAVFLGTFYPDLNAFLGYGQRFQTAFALAKEYDLYQKSVFFEFGWVPHADVKDYLYESDIGVCTYFRNLETRYSHRTRFVDFFWAEKPLICTRGDLLAEMIEERGLGVVVEEGDAESVASAIRRLVDDEDFYRQCQQNLRAIKPELTWDVAMESLVRFCRDQDPSAPAKSARVAPLVRRIGEYLIARLHDRIAPKQQ